MYQEKDRVEQGSRLTQQQPSWRESSFLSRVQMIALLGLGLVYLFEFVLVWQVIGVFVPVYPVFVILAALAGDLLWTRLSWMPMFGTVIATATALAWALAPDSLSALLHPAVNAGHLVR